MASQPDHRSDESVTRKSNDTEAVEKGTGVEDGDLDAWVVEEWDEDDDEDLEDGAREVVIEFEDETEEANVGSD